jgi:hypothetical protein
MDDMFRDATGFTGHNLTDWKVKSVTTHKNFIYRAGTRNKSPRFP